MKLLVGHLIAFLLVGLALPVEAAIRIRGVTAPIRANVAAYLSLSDADDEDFSDPVIRGVMAANTARETRQALEPFGYYHPKISVILAEHLDGKHQIQIDPGPATLLTRVRITFEDSDLDAVDLAAIHTSYRPATNPSKANKATNCSSRVIWPPVASRPRVRICVSILNCATY